jgi:nitroreductase
MLQTGVNPRNKSNEAAGNEAVENQATNQDSSNQDSSASSPLLQPLETGFPAGGFPADGSPAEKLRFFLGYAILAPSNHNSQPWRWRISNDTVELYADRMRALPHTDPDDRELTLSCGAALFHLRIAMEHFGYRPEVQIFPEHEDPNLLATVRLGEQLGEQGVAPKPEDALFSAIPLRHTNRHPFLERDLPASLKSALADDARKEGAWLVLIEDVNARMEVINLIAKSDLMQGHDPEHLQEIAGWMRSNRNPSSDGIPQHATGGGGMGSRYAADAGAALSDKDRLLAWSAPVLSLLLTEDDTPRDWLAAGQALARVLLRASAEGVQASFFNSPIEVVEMWPQLHHIIKRAGMPQMLLRLGYPALETSATPRRSVDEVTESIS